MEQTEPLNLIPSSEDSEFMIEPPIWKMIPEHSIYQDLRALLLDWISCKTQKNGYSKD